MNDFELRITSMADIQAALDWPEIKPDNEWAFEEGKYIVNRANGYEIELERCRTSAEVLDWIFQIYLKSWATAKTIHDLLTHFQKHINPQATLCSYGLEQSGRKA